MVAKVTNKTSPLEILSDLASLDANQKVSPTQKLDPVLAREAEEKNAIKRSISPYWAGNDTISSYTDKKDHKTTESIHEDSNNNTRKTIVPSDIEKYYRDTLESMEKSHDIDAADKTAITTQNDSPYYQSSIGPAIKPEHVQPSIHSDEEDAKIFMNAMTEFLEEAKRAEDEGEINIEALVAEIFRMQINFQEEASDLSKAQLRTARSERSKINEDRLKKMDEIMDRARATKTWDRVSGVATGLQLAAAAVGLSLSSIWGMVALGVLVTNTLVQSFADQFVSYVSPNSDTANNSYLSWFKAGMQLISAGVSLYSGAANGVGFAQTLNGLAALGKGATGGFGGINTYQNNVNHGDMMKLTDELTQKDSKMKAYVKDLQSLFEEQLRLWKTMRENAKKSGDTTQFLFAQ